MTDTIGRICINVRSEAEHLSQLHMPHGTISKQYDKRKKRYQTTDMLRRNGTGMRKRSLRWKWSVEEVAFKAGVGYTKVSVSDWSTNGWVLVFIQLNARQ